VLFIFGVTIGLLQPILAIVVTLASSIFFWKEHKLLRFLIILGAAVLLVFSSASLTLITRDDTVDGTAYHEPAVGALRYGWNPVSETVQDFYKKGNPPFKLNPSDYGALWVNHYPKAHWIYGANMYRLTGNIETGRSMNVLVMFILLLLTFSYVIRIFKPGVATLLALLVAFNPIGVTQLFSYYNDGMMGNLLFIMIVLLTVLIDKKRRSNNRIMLYAFLSMVIAIAINTKFTGFVYTAAYCLAYLLFMFIVKPTKNEYIKFMVAGVVALVVGVFIIGLSVYPKNFIQKGNPFYPLAGQGSVDIITSNEPASFQGMRGIKKLFIANYSQTSNVSAGSGTEPSIKPPLTLGLSELPSLSLVDARIGGYGVWFSGVLTISILCIVGYACYVLVKRKWKYEFWLLTVPLVATIGLLLVVSDAWWARYFPQMYVLPMAALIMLLARKRAVIAAVLTSTILFNIVLSMSIQFPAQHQDIQYTNNELSLIDKLTDNGKYTPKVYLNGYAGYAYRFYDRYGKIDILSKPLDNYQGTNKLDLSKHILVYR